MKETFIHNEIWLLTTIGGFQRSNLYNKKVKSNEKVRKNFRDALHKRIKKIALSQYASKVEVDEHLININNIIEFTTNSEFAYLLNKGKLNFGVSQKLLNLYLKYLWCIDKINAPPHFPVDRIIQVKLNKESENLGLQKRKITAWTQMQSESEYMDVISHANKILEHSNFSNLAELELNLFERS